MKIFNSLFFKGIVPVSLMACSFSGFSAMEVKGFELAEQDKIRNVYGACHRLEEPLTVRVHVNTDFVAAGQGWQFNLHYTVNEDKKYKTQYLSADDDKLTTSTGSNRIFVAEGGGVGDSEVPTTHQSRINGNSGGNTYYLQLPTRNLSFLRFEASSPTNENGGIIAWDKRDGNYLKSSGFLQQIRNPKKISTDGFSSEGGFNLLNVDYLEIVFVQTMGGVGFYPAWEIYANKMNFVDRGPYTAAQYKAACQ
ncbi:hypothetical protein C3433_15515 [Citrobacter freundii]|nr:hypothetical protein C3433_15515 [Citrobacter freundii]